MKKSHLVYELKPILWTGHAAGRVVIGRVQISGRNRAQREFGGYFFLGVLPGYTMGQRQLWLVLVLLLSRCIPGVGAQTPTGPTGHPTRQPSAQPSRQPTGQPTRQPTGQPTRQPTRRPTGQPTGKPTALAGDKRTATPTALPTPAIPNSFPISLTVTLQLYGILKVASVSTQLKTLVLKSLAKELGVSVTQLSVPTLSTGGSSGGSSGAVELEVIVTAMSYSFAPPSPAAAVTQLLVSGANGMSLRVRESCSCAVDLLLLRVVDNAPPPSPQPTSLPFPDSYFELTPAYQFMMITAAAVTVVLAVLGRAASAMLSCFRPCCQRCYKRYISRKVGGEDRQVKRELTEDAVRLLIQEHFRAREVEEEAFESKMEESRYASKPPPI